MEIRPRHNLDNPTFRARLRGTRRATLLDRPHSAQFNGRMSDINVGSGKPRLQATYTIHTPGSSMTHQGTAQFKDIQPPAALKKTVTAPSINAKLPKQIPTPRATVIRPDLPKQKKSNVLKRQAVKPLTYTKAKKHKRPFMPALISGLAIFLFAAGVLVLVNSLRTNRMVKAQVKVLAQKTENDNGISEGTPSEANPPSAAGNSNYQVSAELPRLLTIDKIDVSARIRRVGVGPNNILNAPANIYDVGWYDGSAKPGENGTIVLDGHVSGPTKHGVFYSLGTLKAGDKIVLERGDGKKFSYSVTGTQLFDNDKVDMAKVVTSSVPGKPGLNLMTCAGRFNVRTNQFEQRVVVYAVQD